MIEIKTLGIKPYLEVYQLQKELVIQVQSGLHPETLIVCSHPPIVTLGKKSRSEDLTFWSGETISIERGGQATYHGPGQVIIYPIIHLKQRGQNIAGFLESLELAIINCLFKYDIKATGNKKRGQPDFTGVWIEEPTFGQMKKIASIGVAVSRWVTYHGLAFNLHEDPLAFQGINPCGFTSQTMTSLESVLQKKIQWNVFSLHLATMLQSKIEELVPIRR